MALPAATSAVLLGLCLVSAPVAAGEPYRIVDTGQAFCYGDGRAIPFPKQGERYFGQDAQVEGHTPAYKDNGDGTIADLNTGLVWQKTPDFAKRTLAESRDYAAKLTLAGHKDWRLPTIKELFSITDFRGNMHSRTPYIDTTVFDFQYPDPAQGGRDMDAQYRSSTIYLGTTMRGDRSIFGFNFADGRIKAYPLAGRGAARQYVRCVRGPAYAKNDFVDNGDGTLTDRATGLMWAKADSPKPMNWPDALAHAEAFSLAGHDDWRLPNVKELHSIVDYARAPDARDAAARAPAIDPIFELTKPESWHWTSTTHVENQFAYYVCFGQAFSAMRWRGKQVNAHGAGAVRSDPKTGDPSRWPNGLGPQKDEIRILNYVRCVRGGRAVPRTAPPPGAKPPKAVGRTQQQPLGGRFVRRLDKDGDGKVSPKEFDGPADHFRVLDRNRDGYLDETEAPRRGPPPRR